VREFDLASGRPLLVLVSKVVSYTSRRPRRKRSTGRSPRRSSISPP
jgi:hypothetical protein